MLIRHFTQLHSSFEIPVIAADKDPYLMVNAKIEDIAGCLTKDVLHPEIASLR